jgi:membrane associated rhomboid family serine protease
MGEDKEAARGSDAKDLKGVRLTWAQYFAYHSLLFAFYWLGCTRLDYEGETDFDASDVVGLLGQGLGWLTRNFRQERRVLTPAAGRRRPSKHVRTLGPTGVEREAPRSEDKRSEKFETVVDCNLQEVAPSTQKQGAGKPGEEIGIRIVKQRLPIFTVSHVLLVFGLWLGCAWQMSRKEEEADSEMLTEYKAGLETFWEGKTDLLLFGPNCEDYRMEAWRWITYQFTHVGISHASVNAVLLVLLGIPMEGLHGFGKTCLFFYFGVLCGALCYFVNDAHTRVVGCSAGCYALLLMHIVDLSLNWCEKKYRIATLTLCFLMIGTELAVMFFTVGSDEVSHSVRFGGSVAGIICGMCFGRNRMYRCFQRFLSALFFLAGAGLVAFTLYWMIINTPGRNIWDRDAWCWARQVVYQGSWACVRCADQTCIDQWSIGKVADVSIRMVSITVCDRVGWLHQGR